MSSEWVKKLFSEPQTLGVIVTSGVIGMMVGVAQGVVQKRHGGWGGFIASVSTAAAVSVITGLAIEGFVSSETTRMAIIGVCAVVSEDIWQGLKTLGMGLRADPFGFIVRVLDALRGRESASRPVRGDHAHRRLPPPVDDADPEPPNEGRYTEK